ncbi:MAG: sulfatase [bacterium]|nr:sulfatase [bacterium]
MSQFRLQGLLVAGVLAMLSMGRTAIADDGGNCPNVLFIAVDDLNDWVGFLGGHPQALTPNIDRLAARGIALTNAHCAAPACNPSRAAVFSGQMPWKTGVWSNTTKRLFQAKPDVHVLPDSFRDAGYTTIGTGKLMHSGATSNKRLFERHFNVEQRWSPLTRKQTNYTKGELPTKGSDQPRHDIIVNGRQVTLPLNGMPSDRNPDAPGGESFDWGPFDIKDSDMGDEQITTWAIKQLADAAKSSDDRATKPFFLGVGYYRPHIPLFAPREYFERFKDHPAQLPPRNENDLDDLSALGKKWAIEAITAGSHATVKEHDQWREAVEAYLACTTFVDKQIGRLLNELDSGKFGDNTVIVLWSDHGWHLGEKQHWGKWTGWERSTRVPLIIVPPKRLASEFAKGGSRCDSPVSLIDLFPTLIEMCHLKPRDQLDGESLVPLLRGPDATTGRVIVTSFEPGNVSVRDNRWRLIRYTDGSQELYDLKEDPNEWRNLAGNAKYQKQSDELAREIPASALP